MTTLLLVTAVVSAISGFLYGYDTGIISGALLLIGDEFNTGAGWDQVIAASILLGAVIGALVGARVSERYGRKRTILVIATVFVVGTLACSLAPSELTLALARVLLGTAVGGATQRRCPCSSRSSPRRRSAGVSCSPSRWRSGWGSWSRRSWGPPSCWLGGG